MYENIEFINDECIKVLPEKKLNECIKKYKAGNYEYRNIIITSNIPLVVFQVKRKNIVDLYEKQDLFSVGCIGLMKAVDTYDINRNIKFSTYASKCINSELFMYFRKKKKFQKEVSFNTIKNDRESNNTYEDLLKDNYDLQEAYEKKSLIKELINIINMLPDTENKIISMYFGIGTNRRYTQEEIAGILNFK